MIDSCASYIIAPKSTSTHTNRYFDNKSGKTKTIFFCKLWCGFKIVIRIPSIQKEYKTNLYFELYAVSMFVICCCSCYSYNKRSVTVLTVWPHLLELVCYSSFHFICYNHLQLMRLQPTSQTEIHTDRETERVRVIYTDTHLYRDSDI